MSEADDLAVVAGHHVEEILADRHAEVIEITQSAYARHSEGQSVNPSSHFLRLPEGNSRIIALPAYLGGPSSALGIKWIASFPSNIMRNLQRASAVIVLNSPETGYPLALIEGSLISMHRTAAMAAIGASALHPDGAQGRYECVGVVGAGKIAQTILTYLSACGIGAGRLRIYDLEIRSAESLAKTASGPPFETVEVVTELADAIAGCDLVVLATTAAEPHIADAGLLAGAPTVLNVSLRDLSVEVVVRGQNILDDVDHCLTAGTSPHLAELATGTRDFVAGTLHDVLIGKVAIDRARPRILSPFGLGVLDIALAQFCLEEAEKRGYAQRLHDFLPNMRRY